MKKLSKITIGLEVALNLQLFFCKHSILAEWVLNILQKLNKCKNEALVNLYADFIGLITLIGYNKSKNCLFLTDNGTTIMAGKLFKTKLLVVQAISGYINKMKQQLKQKLNVFKSDNIGRVFKQTIPKIRRRERYWVRIYSFI